MVTLNQHNGCSADELTFGNKEGVPTKPGAFVRQILSCMCSLSGSWDLAGRYPEIRRIILEQSKEKLPEGIELGMALYVGPRIRIMGPQLIVSTKTNTWRWCQEIAFPPFAFLLVIASNDKKPGLGLLLDDMTILNVDQQQSFSGIFEIGFGWRMTPGDYRSQGTILASRSGSKAKYNKT